MTARSRSLLDITGEIARFGIVGVTATAVHYGVAYAVAAVFGYYIGNVFGYLAAVGVSYLGHQRWTFKTERIDHRRQLPRFIATSLGAVAASQGVLFVALSLFAWPDPLALAAAVATVPPITFLLTRFWVFR
ncbi:GtrA family protein [uncultured Rhodospira sp.]|uniref:GtrA family protein n=1 Tax=uncultured Rhodospira sp. TaxID=1936189 RepID=UPI002630AC88|nr:GtrA family protein [uncultured Rhodospira sp.]